MVEQPTNGSPVRLAVILAAGRGTRLKDRGRQVPKGFIRIGDRPIIEESLDRLTAAGIEQVTIVTGHLAGQYQALARSRKGVYTCHNPAFADSGSMYSLYQLNNRIHEPFLLLESDLVYEPRALEEVIHHPHPNVLLVSGPTGSGDEVWVDANDGHLTRLTKKSEELVSIFGELVGITKVSPELFQIMCHEAHMRFSNSLHMEYEAALTLAASRQPVHCLRINDLAWAEIDTEEHLARVIESVYPRILASS